MTLFLLIALQVSQVSPTDTVVAAALKAVVGLTDTAAVRAAGYRPLEEARVFDRTPFQGQHWSLPVDTLHEVPLARPAFIMFGVVNGELKRVGVAYAARLRLDASVPDGLGGDRTAAWHEHYWCRDASPGATPVPEVTPEQCIARGGTPLPRKTVMVHVWTDVPNPEGRYGHDNPALPFLAEGLRPPSVHDLHDPARARRIRALGMALGETRDSRLQIARRVERDNTDASLAAVGRSHRAAIAARIPSLRRADDAGDRATYDRVASEMIAEWESLLQAFERMALTPDLRRRVRDEHEAALTVSAHQ